MKKIYQKPFTEVVTIATEQMICESLQVFGPTSSVDEKAARRRNAVIDDEAADDDAWSLPF